MTGWNAPSRLERGFTLVELMVALTGGLFVSVMVFTLAKDSSRFYMRESRVADATLAAVSGFERLRTDLARSSFMASPNIRRDVQNARLCGNPGAGWPQELGRLAGVRIQPDTPAANAALAANGLAPDAIQIAGNFSGNDVFAMSGVVANGAGFRVSLQSLIGQLGRLDYENRPAERQTLLQDAFPAGRALRIVDEAGMIQYGRITNVTTNPGPAVNLALVPALRMRGANPTLCGLHAQAKGYVNVVNFVRYQVRALTSGAGAAGATPWDTNRTELVREEVNVDGATIAGTEEIVAEYAVDLSFGLTVAQTIVNGLPTQLLTVPAGNAAIVNWAGDVTTTAGAANQGPHRVRAIRVRLAVRSREPDRDANIVPGGSVATGLYRFNVAANGPARFARVRTLQADVALHNQAMAQ
ncbi:MAG TPA: prepilin-type N-terminal cleavage/methylation domain-containing protein [Polyangiaceae bacterium]